MRGSVSPAKWWAMESSWSVVMVILLSSSGSRRITRSLGRPPPSAVTSECPHGAPACPLTTLDRAGVLDDFEAGGQTWHPAYMRCGDSWEIQIQAKTGRPVAITIEGPDTAYSIEIINRFKTDDEFRKSALPRP